MVVADGTGLPVGDQLYSASPHETTLVEETLLQVSPRGRDRKPLKRLIADRAYDSDALRSRLKQMGIDLICPHRRGRQKPPTQDGRKLRRYRKRWKIERLFAWLGNYRRLVVRWDRNPLIYRAFLHVAFIMICLKRL